MGVLINGQVESIATRKDKSFKLTIGTQEMQVDKAAELIGLQNSLANIYISPNPIQTEMMEEIDKVSVDMVETIKSPSKRMKAVLFLLFEKNPEQYKDFELYYRAKMELMIEKLKTKIDD